MALAPSKTKAEYDHDQKERAVARRISVQQEKLGQRVLREKGTPDRFLRIDTHYLYDGNWRVNVWVHADSDTGGECTKLANSYFVEIPGDAIDNPDSPLVIRSDIDKSKLV